MPGTSAGRNGAGWRRHERRRAHGAVVSATRRATDTLVIVAAVLLIWQGLAQWVGSTALGRSRPDARLFRAFRSVRALCRQRALDRDHLRLGAADRLWAGACARHLDGRAPAVRRGRRADPGDVLFAAEDHALSGDPADLRADARRQGDVRRNPRRAAGRAC